MLCLSYVFIVPVAALGGAIDSVAVASPWPFRKDTASGIPAGARWEWEGVVWGWRMSAVSVARGVKCEGERVCGRVETVDGGGWVAVGIRGGSPDCWGGGDIGGGEKSLG